MRFWGGLRPKKTTRLCYFFGYNYTTLKQEYDTFVRDTEHIQSKNRDLLKNDGKFPENEQKINKKSFL